MNRRNETMPAASSSDLLAEVSAFLAFEARLLDEERYDEWLALFKIGRAHV